MIALAHLTSFVQPLFPHRRTAFLGISVVHFSHLFWCHLKVNISVLVRKSFPSFVMNSDVITFVLKMSLLPSIFLLTTISKFKEIFLGRPQIVADCKLLVFKIWFVVQYFLTTRKLGRESQNSPNY